ncbi:DNA-binding response regulator [Alteromonas sediminis]|uniref:DNA-binding response regulator n=1 Tax=Alteromonas sediminis TaxID=2259342 RepID=A0A3N5ZDF5_9ALTE|nr:response regulator transcription factor [Alteromonas sediminis]RPJ68108.1 DNA-binding response regulator [Alteromonas sediminis]
MISVLLVDDQQLVRTGICSLLSLTDDIVVAHQACDGESAIAQLDEHKVDIVLMDIQMPKMDGISATQVIKEHYPDIPVIMLTTFDDKSQVNAAIQAGAKGYLLKDASLEDLTDAIKRVCAGHTLIAPLAKEKITQGLQQLNTPVTHEPVIEPLTPKELEVLRLMSSGFSNQEIADTLFRSTGTIKNQVSSILAKLGTRDRTRAVIKALELGLI